MRLRHIIALGQETLHHWSADKVPQLGAALAFYSMLSLGPLVLIGIAMAGIAFGHDAARGQIVGQIDGLIGHDGAQAVQSLIEGAGQSKDTGWLATVLGFATLLFGASGMFGQLQDSLNVIWKAPPRLNSGLWQMIKSRFFSFAMVMGCAFLLLVSLVASTLLTTVSTYAQGGLPEVAMVMKVINGIVGLFIISGIFALTFKLLPDTKVAWSDVRGGALLTALLFLIGKGAIGLYLGHSGLASGFGAAGSLVMVLVWVYYSAQILFFGAVFTHAYAVRFGSLAEIKQP